MTSDYSAVAEPAGTEEVERGIASFLAGKLNTTVEPDRDLFESGLVTSMFAMELVVALENDFGIEINGADLQMTNFRSVRAMTKLVCRLRSHAESISE